MADRLDGRVVLVHNVGFTAAEPQASLNRSWRVASARRAGVIWWSSGNEHVFDSPGPMTSR